MELKGFRVTEEEYELAVKLGIHSMELKGASCLYGLAAVVLLSRIHSMELKEPTLFFNNLPPSPCVNPFNGIERHEVVDLQATQEQAPESIQWN